MGGELVGHEGGEWSGGEGVRRREAVGRGWSGMQHWRIGMEGLRVEEEEGEEDAVVAVAVMVVVVVRVVAVVVVVAMYSTFWYVLNFDVCVCVGAALSKERRTD